MSKDRRVAQRRRIRWKALILDPKGVALGECTVVNISNSGARLILNEPIQVPEFFLLVMARNGDVRRQCELTWCTERSVGVRFLRPQPVDEEPVSHMSDALARFTSHHANGVEMKASDQPE